METQRELDVRGETEALRTILKSQYHAALAMLREAIDLCPEALWYDERPTNAYWQVAYHTLFFAHLYMLPNPEAYESWARHQADVQHPDGIPGPADPDSSLALIPAPYSKADALEYWAVCDGMVDSVVDRMDIRSESSGFSWYPIPKLEHQFVSLRHIQHHTAQLADRLRSAEGVGVRWVGARRPK